MSMHICASSIIACTAKHPPSVRFKTSSPFVFKPFERKVQQLIMEVTETMKTSCVKLLEAFVDSAFQFVDQPLITAQNNFAPVEEVAESIVIKDIEGYIPEDFPNGVYIRNGPNPLFGGYKSVVSVFGTSSHTWIEGEGMLHALYIKKLKDGNCYNISYKNRYVQSETFKLENQRNKPGFLPAIEGDSLAVFSALLLNLGRFGKAEKYLSNTNIIEIGGKYYATAENHTPQEIDILTLKTIGTWILHSSWNRPFTSHPKKIPSSGEIVMYGVSSPKPYMELGIISADGRKIIHRVDLKLDRCSLSHDIGVTERYNVILDFPLTIDIERLISGGPLIRYERHQYARIGVMPRYGDGDSIMWFEVEPCAVFHIVNCFENGDHIIVRACKAGGSIIPGPDFGVNKLEWFSKGFKKKRSNIESNNKDLQEGFLFANVYEWRLNMKTGEVNGNNLTGQEFSMDFPIINEKFTGFRNKYGYTQVADLVESSSSGMAKYGGLAKLHFTEDKQHEGEMIKVEYHNFAKGTFCSGAAFVPKDGGVDEDDGWIITFLHNEISDSSQVHIIDAKKFSDDTVAKITLPVRVPYGFHGAFMPMK